MATMLLLDVVETSATVAATRSRTAKVAALADCLAQAPDTERQAITAFPGWRAAAASHRAGLARSEQPARTRTGRRI